MKALDPWVLDAWRIRRPPWPGVSPALAKRLDDALEAANRRCVEDMVKAGIPLSLPVRAPPSCGCPHPHAACKRLACGCAVSP